MSTPHPITLVIGPTAVGKSDFSIDLALKTGAQIISADAYQVYQGMDIGTAKVSKAEQQQVRHHLIDTITPDVPYSVADFITQSNTLISALSEQNIPVIICGGTAFYSHSFLYGFEFNETKIDEKTDIKTRLEQRFETDGIAPLLTELEAIDPKIHTYMDVQNPRRVIRGLEIFHTTGQKPSTQRTLGQRRSDVRVIGLYCEREELIVRINQRVDKMIDAGLVEEVEDLLKQGYAPACLAFEAIGYKQVIAYLAGHYDFDTMVEWIKIRTRQFAKRQMTWFRRFEDVEWIDVLN